MASPPTTTDVPAVVRAISLLEAVAEEPGGLTAGDLEPLVDGSRSGLYALLSTLCNRGWLVRDDQGRATIGPALSTLVTHLPGADTLRSAFHEVIAHDAPTESVALVVGASTPTVATVHHPPRSVRCSWEVGDPRPDGAEGPLLRGTEPASQPPPVVARRHTDELVEVAAPVCHDGHTPIAAVVIGLPLQRADDEAVARACDAVEAVARRVSLRLGALTWQPFGHPTTDGTSRALSDDEIAEVVATTGTARLACVRPDGTPHVVPLWFEWDDDRVLLAAAPGSAWFSHIGAAAPVSLVVEGAWPRTHRVTVTGTAKPTTDVPGGMQGLLRRLTSRNPGTAAPDAVQPSARDEWQAVELHPERIVGHAGVPVTAEVPT